MAREMADLGFSHVELSHGIRITLVPGLLRAVEEEIVRISSTHNFCPLPTGIVHAAPNLFEPSAHAHQEHDQWLRHTRRSIDFAAQVGARVLVCHLGSVRFFWFDPADRLRAYAARHPGAALAADAGYRPVLAKAAARLRRKMGPFWERTQASVREVLAHAAAKGVKLGFENREKFTELPLDDDFPAFLASLPPDAAAGYWHDTGHADLKQAMGVIDHRAHLARLAPQLLGFHLHDVDAEGHDHQAIGAGKIDFRMVREFWRPEHLLVLELHPRLAVDDVRASKARIEALLSEP
ncbi:MAG: sugar phosphate isomerase/epimerase [Verrucomicrobia bacterium]|nr:sugar phosphate isomerase/epimerase [Verrucomicrobiota bacterium]